MGLKRGYMYLALLGLETALREMADEFGLVQMSNRKIAVKLQIGQRQLNEMITELADEGRLFKTRGLVRLNGYLKELNGSVKELSCSVTDARQERVRDLRDHEKHGDHETLSREKKKKSVVADEPRLDAADKPRRHTSSDLNAKKSQIYQDETWRLLWDSYPHNQDVSMKTELINCVDWLAKNLKKVGGWNGGYFDRIWDYIEKKPPHVTSHKLSNLLKDDTIEPPEAWSNP